MSASVICGRANQRTDGRAAGGPADLARRLGQGPGAGTSFCPLPAFSSFFRVHAHVYDGCWRGAATQYLGVIGTLGRKQYPGHDRAGADSGPGQGRPGAGQGAWARAIKKKRDQGRDRAGLGPGKSQKSIGDAGWGGGEPRVRVEILVSAIGCQSTCGIG